MHLFNIYLKNEDSVPLKIPNQALDHLHPVHKIPNYSKHPEEKAKSIVRNQNSENLRKYPHVDAMKRKSTQNYKGNAVTEPQKLFIL